MSDLDLPRRKVEYFNLERKESLYIFSSSVPSVVLCFGHGLFLMCTRWLAVFIALELDTASNLFLSAPVWRD